MGVADTDPQDGQVTLYELERYVKDRVRMDTRSADNRSRQNPVFCCSEKNDVVMSKVDVPVHGSGGNAYTLKKRNVLRLDERAKDILALLESGDSYSATGRMITNPHLQDTVVDNLHKLFSQAIIKKELIDPAGTSASYYLNRLLPL